jgi:hypothetical protein
VTSIGPGGGGGQREDHGEPAAGGVFGFHGAAHRLGQAARHREAEAEAGSVAWVAEPAEGLEHPLPVGRRDTRSVIDHAQLDLVSGGPGGQQRRRRRTGVAQGVAGQVHDDSFGDRRVGHNLGQPGRDVRQHRLRLRAEGLQRGRDDLAQVDGPREHRSRAGLQPAHVQQARHEMGEPVQGLLGGGQQVRAVVGGEPGVIGAQAADRRLGRGERRAQVMADRREQRRPLPIGLGHPGGLRGQAVQDVL